jgi:hypothetical protein
MLVATSARSFVFAATVIIASVLGTAGAVTASAASTGAVAGQAHPAAVTHVVADGLDDTPWG